MTAEAVVEKRAVDAMPSPAKRVAVSYEPEMQLRVKKLSENGKLPVRGSPLAAGYDLFRYAATLMRT
jgi:hypothetical protein